MGSSWASFSLLGRRVVLLSGTFSRKRMKIMAAPPIGKLM